MSNFLYLSTTIKWKVPVTITCPHCHKEHEVFILPNAPKLESGWTQQLGVKGANKKVKPVDMKSGEVEEEFL